MILSTRHLLNTTEAECTARYGIPEERELGTSLVSRHTVWYDCRCEGSDRDAARPLLVASMQLGLVSGQLAGCMVQTFLKNHQLYQLSVYHIPL